MRRWRRTKLLFNAEEKLRVGKISLFRWQGVSAAGRLPDYLCHFCHELCRACIFPFSHSVRRVAVCLPLPISVSLSPSLSRLACATACASCLFLFILSLPLVFGFFLCTTHLPVCVSLSLAFLRSFSVFLPLCLCVDRSLSRRRPFVKSSAQRGRRRARLRRTTQRSCTAAAASWAIRRTSATRKSLVLRSESRGELYIVEGVET